MIEPNASQHEDSLARIRTLSEGIKIPSATVTPRDCFEFPIGSSVELPIGLTKHDEKENNISTVPNASQHEDSTPWIRTKTLDAYEACVLTIKLRCHKTLL